MIHILSSAASSKTVLLLSMAKSLSRQKSRDVYKRQYVFTCTEASYVSGELLNTLSEKSAVARFVIGDADAPDMAVSYTHLLQMQKEMK